MGTVHYKGKETNAMIAVLCDEDRELLLSVLEAIKKSEPIKEEK